MTEVFHVATRPTDGAPSHVPGTVLQHVAAQPTTYPGGRDAALRRYPGGLSSHGSRYLVGWPQPNDQPAFVAEAVFEAVRLAEHPEKPSRMTAWFASETLIDARAFVAAHRQAVFVDIWRAQGEVLHRGNMALLNALALPVVAAIERASAYWRGDQGPAPAAWEVLTAPGMTLVEIVETTGHHVQMSPDPGGSRS